MRGRLVEVYSDGSRNRCANPCEWWTGTTNVFKGRVDPRLAGRRVYFQYKRPNASRWKRVGTWPEWTTSHKHFHSRAKRHWTTVDSNGRYGLRITAGFKSAGRFRVRARIPATSGWASDSVTKRVRVFYAGD